MKRLVSLRMSLLESMLLDCLDRIAAHPNRVEQPWFSLDSAYRRMTDFNWSQLMSKDKRDRVPSGGDSGLGSRVSLDELMSCLSTSSVGESLVRLKLNLPSSLIGELSQIVRMMDTPVGL
jgi:hypothetical protein